MYTNTTFSQSDYHMIYNAYWIPITLICSLAIIGFHAKSKSLYWSSNIHYTERQATILLVLLISSKHYEVKMRGELLLQNISRNILLSRRRTPLQF